MNLKEYSAQLKAMLVKNGKLHLRRIGGTISEVLAPLLLMGACAIVLNYYLADEEYIRRYESGYILHFRTIETERVAEHYSYSYGCNREYSSCYFAIAPDTYETRSFGQQLSEEAFEIYPNYSIPVFKYFESEEVLEREVKESPSDFYAGIVFKDNDLNSYSLYTDSYYLPPEIKPSNIFAYRSGFIYNASRFVSSRFAALQREIDSILIKRGLSKTKASSLNIRSYSKILPGYSETYATTGPILGYIVACATACGSIPLFSNFLYHLISEKKAKSREFLFILGLKKSVYWLSWFITAMIPGLLYVIICIVLDYIEALSGDVFMMIIAHLLYVVSLILFATLLQTVVKSAIVATIWSILWISVPALFVSVISMSKTGYGLLCLVSPFAFVFTVFKESMDSFTPNRLVPMATDELSYAYLISMLFVDCVLYGVLSWYFNEILTGDYGVAKPWNFPFKKSYWVKSSPEIEIEELDTEEKATDSETKDSFEDDAGVHPGVVITDLTKEYSQRNASPVLAANKVNAVFGENRITSLLGHNGAGKSTTINMLIGLITPTSGNAVIGGNSILTDMDEIRKYIGICTQEDLIFPDFTAPEHLELVARLRRYTSPNLRLEIKATLASVGLPEKEHKNMRAKKFSGGMKRKLSLAIAIFGDPKVVILDEPTTGIDAASKRKIWDTFIREKEGKTIILTTHSMEEADALSDYIYIMSTGSIKCGGSSMFLKNKFGTGYYINFEKGKGFNSKTVLAVVKKTIPSAEIHSETQEGAVINIPFDNERLFPTILKELDAGKEQLCIKNYGLSLTTLEDVFIRMGTEKETSSSQDEEKEIEGDNLEDEKEEKAGKKDTYSEKLRVLDYEDDYLPPSSIKRQFSTVFLVNWLFYARRKLKTAAILLFPALLALVFAFPFKYVEMSTPIAKEVDTYASLSNTRTTIPYAIENDSGVDTEALNEMLMNVATVYPKISFEEFDSVEEIDEYTSRKGGFIGGLGISAFEPDEGRIAYTFLYNETIPESGVQVQNLMHTALMGYMSNESESKIDTWSHPINVNRYISEDISDYVMNIVFVIFSLFGFLIASAFGAQRLIYERESLFKSQLFQSGMNPFVYCIGNIVSLAIPTFISAVLLSIVSKLIGINSTSGILFLPFFLTLAIFAFSSAAFIYLFSKLFKKADSCPKWVVLSQILLTALPTILESIFSIYVLRYSAIGGFIEVLSKICDYVLPLIPVCSFVGALDTLLLNENKQDLSYVFGFFKYGEGYFGFYFTYLIISFFLFLIASILVDYFVENYMFYPATNKGDNPDTEESLNENEDVKELRKRAEDESKSRNDSVTSRNLRKKYSKKSVAVKNLSISIKHHECFGLLGPNGAGKTTTVQMLTCDLSPTSGTMTVDGNLMRGKKKSFYEKAHIGRCPQEDPLVDYLTPTEHVNILLRVRSGLVSEDIEMETAKIFKKIGLEEYANREAVALSGGTRRKLSVALSLLPGSQVIFLDEPSTGMDPVARRNLWSIIQEEQKKEDHTIVLTTHSMEEAEAVCTNIAIIKEGALTCYGSVQHIKSQYSDGYHVTVELSSEKMDSPEECDQAITSLCSEGEGILLDAAGHRRTYNIGKVESLANLFEQLEGLKGSTGIVSYMVTQTTLEDVFLILAKQNEEV